MATVVVVQSDQLAAWIGVAGVVVGVALTTVIDSWHTRQAKRKQMRADLLRAKGMLFDSAVAVQRARRVDWDGQRENNDPSWAQLVLAQEANWREAMSTIESAGVAELSAAARMIEAVASQQARFLASRGGDHAEVIEAGRQGVEADRAFLKALRNAKL